ncbi:MAG: hypothetical protein ACON4T_10765 [Synechococcus sp.]
MATPTWLNLTDLGQLFGISTTHCGRALDRIGWRDHFGRPTATAVEAGAANTSGSSMHPHSAVWNSKMCTTLLESQGYKRITRAQHVKQWVALLEALSEGSAAITTTPEQMAEELPAELVADVNSQLSRRGCHFQANVKSSATAH